MHICVSKLTIIGSDNGLSPGRRQAIIWTNDGILLIRTFQTHFSEIVSEIHTFSFKKMHFKMLSGKWRPYCLGLSVLRTAQSFGNIVKELQELVSACWLYYVNPLRAKLLRENINIYLHLMSFLHANKTQVVEIPPRVRQGPAYSM